MNFGMGMGLNTHISQGIPALLDATGAAQAAYSINKVNPKYSGPCMNIRRSTDNATTDIGFTAAGRMDDAAITTFKGAGNAFVVTWYDQMDNFDVTQGTAGSQPQLFMVDGRYVPRFAATAKTLANGSFMGSKTNSTVSAVWKAPATGTPAFMGGVQLATGNFFVTPWWTAQQSPSYFNSAQRNCSATYESGDWRCHTWNFAGGSPATFTSSEFGEPAYTSVATVTPPAYDLLTMGTGASNDSNMHMAQFVVWDTIVSAATIAQNYVSKFVEYLPTAAETFFMNVGDSISSTTFTGPYDEWTYTAYTAASKTRWYTHGFGTIQNWLDRIDTLLWYPHNLPHATANALLFIGTNDIFTDMQTGAQTFAKHKSLAQQLRAGGYDNIIALTMLPRNVAGHDTPRADFNALLLADVSGDYDTILDLTGVTELSDPTNTTYFVDGTHLTDAGADVVASYVDDVLLTY